MNLFFTSDGDTLWLECFADDPEAERGILITSAEPGTSFADLTREVRKHEEEHGCGTAPPPAVRTEDLYCASPLCAVSPKAHKRTPSCPPVSPSTIPEILAAVAEEAEHGH